MTKSLFGKSIAVLVAVLLAAGPAVAHLNLYPPFAAIEYNPTQAISLHTTAEAFSKTSPTQLRDITAGSGTYWLNNSVTEITELRGYAHIGSSGLTQEEADSEITLIQVWKWVDTNGNGAADAGDTTTEWEKVSELRPSDGVGHVVGWDIPYGLQAIPTSTWQGDILQTDVVSDNAITLTKGQSVLLLIRVVDISGNTSLMASVEGLEQWDNGAVDGVGSDIVGDRYVDGNGNTPGTTDERIQDDDVVWIYVPRLK